MPIGFHFSSQFLKVSQTRLRLYFHMVLMPLKKAIRASNPLQAITLQTYILGRIAIVLTHPTLLLLPPSEQVNRQA